VMVLERVGKEIIVLDDLPSPKSMRIDQLLTSNFFGLRSTIDPEIDEKLTRYYELLAKDPSLLTKKEKKQLDGLRAEVAKYEPRLMAASPGEELLYEAISEFVAKEGTLRGDARQDLPAMREDTKRRVADLLKRQAAASGVAS